jgi:hypothetical protein
MLSGAIPEPAADGTQQEQSPGTQPEQSGFTQEQLG